MKKQILLLLLLSVSLSVSAQKLSVPRFFSDGMVLQRGEKIPVWGKGKAGTPIVVSINGKTAKTTVSADGRWKVYLSKMQAGGPYELTISGKGESTTIKNVLIGDVFLCSGQSNMELPIRRCMDVVKRDVSNYSNDKIRYLKFPHQYNYVRPNDDVMTLPWQNITPENCGEVSGICYFMARELQERYDVPIGIINSAVGGTRVEAWMPHAVLARFPEYTLELRNNPKYHQPNWPDSVRAMENRAAFKWEHDMISSDTIVNQWRTDGYDFSSWKKVDMFSNWSNRKNGSYWFHTSVNLNGDLANKPATLRFGAMKDADTIFVNGQYVGNTTYEYPPRIYNIKEGILRKGKNDIVVHLMSQSGFPNFTQGKLYQLEVDGRTIPISEQLDMAVGCTMPRKPSSTYFVDGNTGLYNAMIAPLCDFPFKGILWYQGESNMGNPDKYAPLFCAMIKSWRNQFGKVLPVVIMQLPGYMEPHSQPIESGWTKIRHQQYLASLQLPNAALAPLLDTGEFNDIHPQDKKTAGHRAALQMEKLAYGEKWIVSSGPTPKKLKVKDGYATITFAKDSGILTAHGRGGLTGMYAVKVNGKYQWAKARISGPYTVEVTLPEGYDPNDITVRYCWDDYPKPTLFNTDDIPAPQFEISL